MAFLYLKALHIIFIVTWFAGLFYIVRLFIYQTEALDKPEPERTILVEQFKILAKRLWLGITWPSAILTLIFGSSLFSYYIDNIPLWLWLKLGFVAGLYGYQLYCHKIYSNLQKGKKTMSSQQLRIWNEIATIFLVSIVFLVVLRSALGLVWGLVGLVIFIIVLMTAIFIYKKIRNSKS